MDWDLILQEWGVSGLIVAFFLLCIIGSAISNILSAYIPIFKYFVLDLGEQESDDE